MPDKAPLNVVAVIVFVAGFIVTLASNRAPSVLVAVGDAVFVNNNPYSALVVVTV